MSEIFVDPKNADIVYVPSQNLYRSNDGGHTFRAIKGAPGGDDYHTVWIDRQIHSESCSVWIRAPRSA